MKVKQVKFNGHSDDYKVSRVDLILDNGESIAVFVSEDGKIELCATNPPKHAPLTPNKGYLVKVSDFGYPSD